MESKLNIVYNLFLECFDGNRFETQKSSDDSDHITSDGGGELEESTAKLTKKLYCKREKLLQSLKKTLSLIKLFSTNQK